MPEKKADLLKNIMINIGILLILITAIAAKDSGVALFLGLILLAVHTFEFKGIEPKKLIAAEIILASSLAMGTVIQLIMSKRFDTPQIFMIVLLLGAILVTVEAVRNYTDL